MSLPGRLGVSSAVVVLFALAVTALAWQDKGPPAGASPPESRASGRPDPFAAEAQRRREDRSNEQAILRTLGKQTTLDVDEMPLGELLARIAEDHGLQIAIDTITLKHEDVALDTPVTLHVAGITLRSALRLILDPLTLEALILDEALTVTTTTWAADCLQARVYDVGRLVRDGNYAALQNVLRDCIDPDTWDDNGGPGSIKSVPSARALAVRQTQIAHERVAWLLAELDRCVHSEPGAVPRPGPDPVRDAETAIREKLASRCTLKSDGNTLETVLKQLAADKKIPLWFDRRPLEQEDLSLDEPVTVQLRAIRVESALNYLLGRRSMGWIVEDEVLKITTAERATNNLVIRLYDIREFKRDRRRDWAWPPTLGGGNSPVQVFATLTPDLLSPYDVAGVMDTLRDTVEPDTWDDNGGAGTEVPFGGFLVIRQTAAIQDQIATVLAELRTQALAHRADDPQPAENPRELTLVVYPFGNGNLVPTAPEVAKLIPELIAPESWKEAGGRGTIAVGPASIAIRQTPAIHREIVRFLYRFVVEDRRTAQQKADDEVRDKAAADAIEKQEGK